MTKNKDLILFMVSFGSLLVLVLTRLDYVLTYAMRESGTTEVNVFSGKRYNYGPLLDAQILGILMIVLAIGSLYFLVKVVRK